MVEKRAKVKVREQGDATLMAITLGYNSNKNYLVNDDTLVDQASY
jgi:hypothetical protein